MIQSYVGRARNESSDSGSPVNCSQLSIFPFRLSKSGEAEQICASLVATLMNDQPQRPLAPKPESVLFYREFLAERQEILVHKWYLSENSGEDVGLDRALSSWTLNHREAWRRHRCQLTRPTRR